MISKPILAFIQLSINIYLFHLLFEDLVKVGDNLIEKAQALNALIVGLKLDVELGEVGDGGEDDAPAVALLVVQLLRQVWSISISISTELLLSISSISSMSMNMNTSMSS